jgi:hypothetical protein
VSQIQHAIFLNHISTPKKSTKICFTIFLSQNEQVMIFQSIFINSKNSFSNSFSKLSRRKCFCAPSVVHLDEHRRQTGGLAGQPTLPVSHTVMGEALTALISPLVSSPVVSSPAAASLRRGELNALA